MAHSRSKSAKYLFAHMFNDKFIIEYDIVSNESMLITIFIIFNALVNDIPETGIIMIVEWKTAKW